MCVRVRVYLSVCVRVSACVFWVYDVTFLESHIFSVFCCHQENSTYFVDFGFVGCDGGPEPVQSSSRSCSIRTCLRRGSTSSKGGKVCKAPFLALGHASS